MPRRNNAKNRQGRDRGLRPLKAGERRCVSCLAVTKPEHERARHQLGCPQAKGPLS